MKGGPIVRGSRVKLKSGEVGIVKQMWMHVGTHAIGFFVQCTPCDNNPCTCGTPGDSFHDDGMRDVEADEVLEVLP